MRLWWIVLALVVGCGSDAPVADAAGVADASTSCWQYECPDDAGVTLPQGATLCGRCKHQFSDMECPPGFVCSCDLECVKGPRSPDGGACSPDAGVIDGGPDAAPDTTPDARVFEWPVCDTSVPPPNMR